ncbi:MAG: ABC transporter ATP-binding protein [Euryarchaeota archaeon]|nr:ABC transporter ATP-binding protein [Euryarchaeota archaeon]
MPAIEVSNLRKRYGKGVLAVDGVSFGIDDGEIFGLLGPNGAGKTTIIKVMTTLLTATEGRVTIFGNERPRNDYEIRNLIGYVPQDVSSDAALTGYENLLISAKLYGRGGKDARRVSEDVLRQLSLWDAKDRVAKTYSGGMIRKLEIGQAMVHDPKILFLDEPTIGLDPVARKQVWAFIRELKERTKMTVIITTHYMEEADHLCDRIAIMSIGKIATIGTPAELKASVSQGAIILGVKGTPPLIPNSRQENGSLVIPATNPARELPGYIDLLRANGCEILSANIRETTLEDAFVKYAGTRIEEMDQWSSVRKMRRVARRMA